MHVYMWERGRQRQRDRETERRGGLELDEERRHESAPADHKHPGLTCSVFGDRNSSQSAAPVPVNANPAVSFMNMSKSRKLGTWTAPCAPGRLGRLHRVATESRHPIQDPLAPLSA